MGTDVMLLDLTRN